LPNSTFFDIEMTSKSLLDKAKPFVRIGRKAAGEVAFNLNIQKCQPFDPLTRRPELAQG
jgi:hypothetical protein